MDVDPLSRNRESIAREKASVSVRSALGPGHFVEEDEPAKPIIGELDRLMLSLESLDRVLEMLGSRLTPVLYQGDPEAKDPGEPSDPSESQIATRIRRARYQVEGCGEYIAGLVRRLEV